MFGDKDDGLRQLTKLSLMYDDPLNSEEAKATIAQMRAINTKMEYLLRDLQSTLDPCGNIVLLDCIENV
jgi:hypothetical protein